MRKIIGASLFVAALGLPLASAQFASADEVKIEQKMKTTSPSGMIVIENPTTRTFRIQGETRTYVAPPDVDLQGLSGKEVTVTMDANGNVTRIERKTTTIE